MVGVGVASVGGGGSGMLVHRGPTPTLDEPLGCGRI